MFGFLGSIFKAILSPVASFIAGALYGALIKFPLEILNFLNTGFLFLSGAAVDKILFNTSISDGGIKMNFFSNPSPVQHFYIIVFSIAGALGGLFLVLATIKTITSSKMGATHGAIVATGRITGGMFLITLIPVLVLGFLSMVGALSNLFTGGSNAAPQRSDITTVRSRFLPRVNSMYNFAADKNSDGSSRGQMTQTPENIYYAKVDYKISTAGQSNISLSENNDNNISSMANNGFNFILANGIKLDNNNKYQKKISLFEEKISSKFQSSKFFTSKTWLDSYEKSLMSLSNFVASENPSVYQIQDQNFKNAIDGLLTTYHTLFSSSSDGLFIKKGDNSLAWNKNTLQQLQDLKKDLVKVDAKKDTSLSSSLAKLSSELNQKMYSLSDFIIANQNFANTYGAEYNLDNLDENFFNKIYSSDMSNSSAVGEYALDTLMHNFKERILPNLGLDAQLAPTSNGLLPVPSHLSKFNDLLAQMNLVLSGDPEIALANKSLISVGSIAEQISNFKAGTIVTALYHLASGNTDYNWHESPNHVKGSRILIGCLAIGAAMFILVGINMFAAKRIFDIAVLFITAPIWVVWSSADEGKRLRQWLDVFLSKILSIIAIIIAMRMLDVVLGGFDTIINQPNFNKLHNLDGDTADLWKAVIMAIIALGGLEAVKKGSLQIAAIFGAGSGLEAIGSMMTSGRRAFSVLKKVPGVGVATAGIAATRVGMGAKGSNGKYKFGTRTGRAIREDGNSSFRAGMGGGLRKISKGKYSGGQSYRSKVNFKNEDLKAKFGNINPTNNFPSTRAKPSSPKIPKPVPKKIISISKNSKGTNMMKFKPKK